MRVVTAVFSQATSVIGVGIRSGTGSRPWDRTWNTTSGPCSHDTHKHMCVNHRRCVRVLERYLSISQITPRVGQTGTSRSGDNIRSQNPIGVSVPAFHREVRTALTTRVEPFGVVDRVPTFADFCEGIEQLPVDRAGGRGSRNRIPTSSCPSLSTTYSSCAIGVPLSTPETTVPTKERSPERYRSLVM